MSCIDGLFARGKSPLNIKWECDNQIERFLFSTIYNHESSFLDIDKIN